jgi:sorting nexin-27
MIHLYMFCVDTKAYCNDHVQYVREARQLAGYGEVRLPHCVCDARKTGHVIPTVSYDSFKMKACQTDGTLEVRS